MSPGDTASPQRALPQSTLPQSTLLKNTLPRPFLKWAGGKTQLLDTLLRVFPKQFDRYIEPFLGGGAVFFRLQPQKAQLSDINPELIDTYKAVRNNIDGVLQHLKQHKIDKEYYYKLRAQQPEALCLASRAARTIFLNKTCFNGLYRVNQQGKFNVPFGDGRSKHVLAADVLQTASAALKTARLACCDVENACHNARPGDLVYFDPPYMPVNKTSSFTAYARFGFTCTDQERLACLFESLVRRGVHAVLSNSNTQTVRALYKGFRITQVQARRNINSCGNKRGAITELVITAKRRYRVSSAAGIQVGSKQDKLCLAEN